MIIRTFVRIVQLAGTLFITVITITATATIAIILTTVAVTAVIVAAVTRIIYISLASCCSAPLFFVRRLCRVSDVRESRENANTRTPLKKTHSVDRADCDIGNLATSLVV